MAADPNAGNLPSGHGDREGMNRPIPLARAGPAVARDHDDAFVELYHRHRAGLVRLATLLVDRPEVAEELVQDAFAAAYREWPRLDEPAAFVRAAVVNRARSELRRRDVRRRRPLHAAPAIEPGGDHVRDAVAALPERQRTAVVLRFYGDLSLDQIAALMGTRTGTVKSQLHKALARLRRDIQP
jgi:RNA polymerase sigma-70 factor (sigma-E family)